MAQTGSSQITSSLGIIDLAWHHVAVTRTETEVRFYVDGVASSPQALAANFDFTIGSAIGALANDLRNSFFGLID